MPHYNVIFVKTRNCCWFAYFGSPEIASSELLFLPAQDEKGARLPAQELKGARLPAHELKGARLLATSMTG